MKDLNGSAPQVVRNPEGAGIKRLFYSVRDIALIKDKQAAPGYGLLKAGTVVGVNASAAGGAGQLVPFVPAYGSMIFGTEAAAGVAVLVQDGASGSVKVSIQDSYKFVVGDELYLQNLSGDGLISLGAITAIDRTTDARWAIISCGAYTATNATVAKSSYVYIKSGGTPFSIAAYILDKDVDTGTGEDATGAQATVVISNAILYKASLVNATAAALTSLGATTDGQHIIIK